MIPIQLVLCMAKQNPVLQKLASQGVRTSMVRLPPIVHGEDESQRLCTAAD